MKKLICLAMILFASASTYLFAQDTTLNDYKGTYRFPDGSMVASVDITVESGVVTISSSLGTATLEKVSKDTFNLIVYNGNVYFTRNKDGKVDGIKIVVQETVLEGRKDGANLAMIRRRSSEFMKQSFYEPVIG